MLASIQNYYEHLVLEAIQDALGNHHAAQDADFVADLACVALNRLPARYIRHTVDLWSHIGDDDRAAMRQEVRSAVAVALATMRRRRESRPGDGEDYEPVKARLPGT